MKLHASGEDYLEAILVLQKKLGMVRSVDVARHMGVSKAQRHSCHNHSAQRWFLRWIGNTIFISPTQGV